MKEKKVGEKRKKADEVADTMVSKEGFDDEISLSYISKSEKTKFKDPWLNS
jgi:hypothetical protein